MKTYQAIGRMHAKRWDTLTADERRAFVLFRNCGTDDVTAERCILTGDQHWIDDHIPFGTFYLRGKHGKNLYVACGGGPVRATKDIPLFLVPANMTVRWYDVRVTNHRADDRLIHDDATGKLLGYVRTVEDTALFYKIGRIYPTLEAEAADADTLLATIARRYRRPHTVTSIRTH